jgi:type III pantothenate kinase
MDQPWLALAIGNSRLHWALEMPNHPRYLWHTPHLSEEAIAHLIHSQWNLADLAEKWDCQFCGIEPEPLSALINSWDHHNFPLWIASVVRGQAQRWQTSDRLIRQVGLADVPIQGLYSTLGIDRALALWGLLQRSQTDSLVIDAGTALTMSAATAQLQFVGGAILPGLSSQLRVLATETAALPSLRSSAISELPSRWGMTTQQSIHSGIVHTMLSGIVSFALDWKRNYPKGAIALTGGDSQHLHQWLHQAYPNLGVELQWLPELIFDGMRSLALEGDTGSAYRWLIPSMKKRNQS